MCKCKYRVGSAASHYVSIRRTTVHVSPANVYNKRFRSFFSLRRPLFLPSQPEHLLPVIQIPLAHLTFHISSTCCTYSLPLQCMILPPPRGDPSHPLHQSSSRLRRPERPRQKARCAPSRAAILAGYVARLVTCLGARAKTPFPISPPLYTHMLIASSPSTLPSRNVTNGRMQRAVARRVSVSASNALALARSAPIGSRYVLTRGRTLFVSWGSHRIFFPTVGKQ